MQFKHPKTARVRYETEATMPTLCCSLFCWFISLVTHSIISIQNLERNDQHARSSFMRDVGNLYHAFPILLSPSSSPPLKN